MEYSVLRDAHAAITSQHSKHEHAPVVLPIDTAARSRRGDMGALYICQSVWNNSINQPVCPCTLYLHEIIAATRFYVPPLPPPPPPVRIDTARSISALSHIAERGACGVTTAQPGHCAGEGIPADDPQSRRRMSAIHLSHHHLTFCSPLGTT